MVSLQLAQFERVVFIAKVSQLEVDEALVEVRQPLCGDPEKTGTVVS